jgi:hypothetical protein
MTARKSIAVIAAVTLTLFVGGCAYDYLQHTDKIAYNSGDAVRANIEGQTIDPDVSTSTKGLGKNGKTDTAGTPTP